MSGTNDLNTPPAWLRWLGNDASRALVSDQSPVGCHHYFDDSEQVWEVTLFVSATEVVGGPKDGTRLPPHFQLDVQHLSKLFDTSPVIRWQAGTLADDDMLGDHISCEGLYRGRKVWLRVLAHAPDSTEPGSLLHAATGKVEVLWDET